MDTQKLPGPDHPITITAARGRMRARYNGHVVADSDRVLMLDEAGYHPVAYFPRDHISMEYFSDSDRRTHCPYKGYASYLNVLMDGQLASNAAWSYVEPYPAMQAIAGRVAFFPHPVEVYEVEDSEGRSPDEAVLHTDDGAGRSQREHWPATTRDPRAP